MPIVNVHLYDIAIAVIVPKLLITLQYSSIISMNFISTHTSPCDFMYNKECRQTRKHCF